MSNENGKTQRCCDNCYHFAWFFGEVERTCEITGRPKKRPNNYTNCKSFVYPGMMGAKVVEK